jgi:hypothetical protein
MKFSAPATAALLMVLPATIAYAEGANHFDKLDQLKPGVTTKKDAVKLLGKPMCENMVEGCALCTFSDGKQTITLKFDKQGVLEDRKDWGHK